MAFSLSLPPPLPAHGWKVKIRDRERSEPPHITTLQKTRAWRVNLRTHRFMDSEPNPSDVPNELPAEIERHWSRLCDEWDAMYPENPVDSHEADDE